MTVPGTPGSLWLLPQGLTCQVPGAPSRLESFRGGLPSLNASASALLHCLEWPR